MILLNFIYELYSFFKKLYYDLLKKKIYYVIGDSHTIIFRFHKYFITKHLGASTAYNLINNNSTTQSRKKLFDFLKNVVKSKDVVILSFGEIDCRIHIFNQFKKNNGKVSIEDLIQKTINNYLSVIKEIQNKNYTIIILGIPPAGREKNLYNYPYYGDEATRSKINFLFNDLMKKKCNENNIKYVELFFVDDKGLIDEKYCDDGVHYNKKIIPIVLEKIKKFE